MNFPLISRLRRGLVAVFALLLTLSGIQGWHFFQLQQAVNDLMQVQAKLQVAAFVMEVNTIGTGLSIMHYLDTSDSNALSRAEKRVVEFRRFHRSFAQLSATPEELAVSQTVEQLFRRLEFTGSNLIALRHQRETNHMQIADVLQQMHELQVTPTLVANWKGGPADMLQLATELEGNLTLMTYWMAQPFSIQNGTNQIELPLGAYRRALGQCRAARIGTNLSQALDLMEMTFERRTAPLIQQALFLNQSYRNARDELLVLCNKLEGLLEDNILHRANSVVESMKAESESAQAGLLLSLALTVSSIILGGALVFIRLDRRVARPIEALRAGAEAFQKGRLEYRIAVQTDDEFGLVAHRFNEMAAARQQVEDRLARLNATLEDQVEQRAAALRASEERLEKVLRAASIGTFDFDLASGDAKWNSVQFDLLGIKPGDARPGMESLLGLVHPADLDRVREAWTNARRTGEFEVEFRIVRADGEERWLAGKGSCAFGGEMGQTTFERATQRPRFLGVNFDITERKRAEAELKEQEQRLRDAAEELSQANKKLRDEMAAHVRNQAALLASEKSNAAGRMAASIAHEINNPLGAMKNAFHLIRNAVTEAHPYFRFVALIDAQVNRVQNIVHHMIGIYRPTMQRPNNICLTELIGGMIELVTPGAQARRITLRGILAPRVIAYVAQGPFSQVMFNLFNNAIDASPAGAVITVTLEEEMTCLRVSVTDQGPGISNEIRSRVFDPFFSTKGDGFLGGVGVGLAVSKDLIESMGGRIGFECSDTGGTTFWVLLPKVAAFADSSKIRRNGN